MFHNFTGKNATSHPLPATALQRGSSFLLWLTLLTLAVSVNSVAANPTTTPSVIVFAPDTITLNSPIDGHRPASDEPNFLIS